MRLNIRKKQSKLHTNWKGWVHIYQVRLSEWQVMNLKILPRKRKLPCPPKFSPCVDFPCLWALFLIQWKLVFHLGHFASISSWYDTYNFLYGIQCYFILRTSNIRLCGRVNRIFPVARKEKNLLEAYNWSSTCCGLGILYPSSSKLAIFFPSILG